MFDLFLTPLKSTSNNQNTGSMLPFFITLALLIVFMYFVTIRPQKKKEKQDAEMRRNLQVGDEVVTIGGIVGIVFSIKDDTVVIETGGDRSKIRVKLWAIHSNETARDNSEK
jgi:preprotein translocase subunit YajC